MNEKKFKKSKKTIIREKTVYSWRIDAVGSLLELFKHKRITGDELGNILLCLDEYEKNGYKKGSLSKNEVYKNLSEWEKDQLEKIRKGSETAYNRYLGAYSEKTNDDNNNDEDDDNDDVTVNPKTGEIIEQDNETKEKIENKTKKEVKENKEFDTHSFSKEKGIIFTEKGEELCEKMNITPNTVNLYVLQNYEFFANEKFDLETIIEQAIAYERF